MEIAMPDIIISENHSSPSRNVVCNTLDIRYYASRYQGHSKHSRLNFIASNCENLHADALKLLIDSLKQSGNTNMYEEITRKVGNSLGDNYVFDKNFFESTEKVMVQRLERAETELSQAKNRMVKESIRIGHMDIGHINMDRGYIQDALISYFRSREFFSAPMHNTEMCLAVAIASIALGLYRQAATYVNKIETLDDTCTKSKIRSVVGLNSLNEGQFRAAAKSFLDVDSSICGAFKEVLSGHDVATYACLCALASHTRADTRRCVLENKAFKPLLDLVPDVRILVQNFCSSNYSGCRHQLDLLKPMMMLDVHMAKHAETLHGKISERILIEYFTPYNSVDLRRMAEAFDTDLDSLEKSLAQLITKGSLTARIDSQAKTLIRREAADRLVTIAKIKRLAKIHTAEIRRSILRLSLFKQGFIISANEAKTNASFGSSAIGDRGEGGLAVNNDMELDPELVDQAGDDHGSDISD